MKKPKIKLTLVEQKGHMGCHRGHRIGDSFDFDTERGKLCPMAMHVAFPYIDILRYGGRLPTQPDGSIRFCCPDVDVINVFQIEVEEAPPCTGSPKDGGQGDSASPQAVEKTLRPKASEEGIV